MRSPSARRPSGTCSAPPTFFPRPTCWARCSWPSIREASVSVTWWPAPSSRATGRPRSAAGPGCPTASPVRHRRCRSSRDAEFQLAVAVRRAPGASSRPRPRASWRPRLAARLSDHPLRPVSPPIDHLLDLHSPRAGRRRGSLAARRRRTADPLRRPEARAMGRLSATGGASGAQAGSTASPRTSSPISPPGIARSRPISPAPAPTAPTRRPGSRLERLVAAGHNALYREERGTWRRICGRAGPRVPGGHRRRARLRAGRVPRLRSAGRGRLHPAPRTPGAGRRGAARGHAATRGGRRCSGRRRGEGTSMSRRRTVRSWRRASSRTTCGSRSPASRAGSSSASVR